MYADVFKVLIWMEITPRGNFFIIKTDGVIFITLNAKWFSYVIIGIIFFFYLLFKPFFNKLELVF